MDVVAKIDYFVPTPISHKALSYNNELAAYQLFVHEHRYDYVSLLGVIA
ncbi:MAG TPA: hypothetical protein VFU31_11540 [Candidatus Binatia bacterium]|nr:hypothetical protein [Candidatus Binatia bacterium]